MTVAQFKEGRFAPLRIKKVLKYMKQAYLLMLLVGTLKMAMGLQNCFLVATKGKLKVRLTKDLLLIIYLMK